MKALMSPDDYVRAMGLGPIWRLRASGALKPAVEAQMLPESKPAPTLPTESPTRIAASTEARTETSSVPASERSAAIAAMSWDQLEQSIADCRACVLCQKRKQAVPGVGDRQPEWLFIGEGPGADEDEQGEPFVGQAGKLLDNMLAAIDLQRGNKVYIANAVKCRPPGNRTPSAEEIASCWPYLQRQIELAQPKLLVLMGRPAVAAVLGGDQTIASLRGQRHRYADKFTCVVTYHPAYLLRNLPDKAKAWQDLCFARSQLAV